MAFWRCSGRAASRCRSSARADRRSASGTRRSTCAPCASCRRSSASRTIRPRSRRRCRRTPRCASSPTRPRATAFRGSRSTAPIRMRSPRRLRGRPSARAPATDRRSSSSSSMRMCGHAHHDDMLYLGKEAQPSWDYPPLHERATPTASSTSSGASAIRSRATRRGSRPRGSSTRASSTKSRNGRRRWSSVEARAVIDAPWPEPHEAGVGVFKDEPPRVRIEVLDPEWRSAHRCASRGTCGTRSRRRGRPALRQEGQHVSRGRDARRRRRAARRSARVRLRPGRRRSVRQRVSAAASAAEGVRRSDPQLAAGRRRRARRLRRRRARRSAADRRDAVQRLRRDRLQSARQQRREDPLPLGRGGADGRAHAVGRPALGRSVSQPEHRAVVLPDARPEDRRPVDAAGRARADGGRRRRSGSGALLRAHRAVSRAAHQTDAAAGRARADADRQGRASSRRQRPRDDFLRRVRARLPARRREARR